MSNAKYSPAPTRDSLDEPERQYTQAPPSYQDAPAAGPSASAATGYGTPREEDDNVPDDFKVSHCLICVIHSTDDEPVWRLRL